MTGQVEHVPVGRAREPVAPAMVLDAMKLLGVLLTAAWSRRPIRPLADEAVRPLPGDEFMADAKVRWTASSARCLGPPSAAIGTPSSTASTGPKIRNSTAPSSGRGP